MKLSFKILEFSTVSKNLNDRYEVYFKRAQSKEKMEKLNCCSCLGKGLHLFLLCFIIH